MKNLILLFGAIFLIAFNDAASLSRKDHKLTLRGRVLFPTGSNIPIEEGAILTVDLQDVSMMDARAKTVGKSVGKAIRFPMAFAIKYKPEEIVPGNRYSLRIMIKNNKDELLYTNDMHIGITPIGEQRTKLIDAPVILVKKPAEKLPKRKWSDLVGKNGEEAVQIIKQETGFTNVMTIKAGSPVTMDYRTDRVRVFVNNRGIVTHVPTIA